MAAHPDLGIASHFIQEAAQANAPSKASTQRFEQAMNHGAGDQYVDNGIAHGNGTFGTDASQAFMKYGTELNTRIRAGLDISSPPISPEEFPEMAAMQTIFTEQRHFVLTDMEFRFADKMVESNEKHLQTLYRQQG